uniref:Uncharacterized protein n=1 Tax=Rhizophora mucronata TaxID=61149 RepID=A0A2P2PV79_RHIMU
MQQLPITDSFSVYDEVFALHILRLKALSHSLSLSPPPFCMQHGCTVLSCLCNDHFHAAFTLSLL